MNKNNRHQSKGGSAAVLSHRRRWKPFGLRVTLILLVFTAWGCSTPPVKVTAPKMQPDQQTVLVLPFADLTQVYGDTGMIQCPICPNYFSAGRVSAGATDFMTELLIEILKRNKDLSVVTRSRPSTTAAITKSAHQRGQKERLMLSEAGRSAGAQVVLTGYIYRFEQRVGRSFTAASPASVAFSVHMIDATSGADYWYGTVDETQAALSDDLFQFRTFIKRRGAWVTAEQMAAAGLERLFGGYR